MHPGISLTDLGNLIIRQKAEKRDFIAPTRKLTFVAQEVATPSLRFDLGGDTITAGLTAHAIQQVNTWAGIPKKYADLLVNNEKNHALLEQNVNHWLQAADAKRMVRAFVNGNGAVTRAFLSDRYRAMDNYDLAHAVMPFIQAAGMEVKSCDVSDLRLYIQAVDKRLVAQIQPSVHQRVKDDVLYGGIVISNSEVGAGSLSIEGLLYRLACTNGMIAGNSFRRYHVGRATGGGNNGSDPFEIFSDETKSLTDKALWAQVQDVMRATLDEANFQALVAKFQAATTVELEVGPTEVIDITAERFDLSESEKEAVMRNLFAEGDSTLFGLANAVTRSAQDVKSYDRAIELERIGSEVLMLDAKVFAKN